MRRAGFTIVLAVVVITVIITALYSCSSSVEQSSNKTPPVSNPPVSNASLDQTVRQILTCLFPVALCRVLHCRSTVNRINTLSDEEVLWIGRGLPDQGIMLW